MNDDLAAFGVQFLRVVIMTLAPVVFTAFVSMPIALERHPGEQVDQSEVGYRHMT